MDKEEVELKNTISRNLLFTFFSRVFYLAIRLFIPPIILSYLSLEEYGIWACCFILINYLSMSVFGISNAYVRYVAVYSARGEIEKVNQLLSTGMVFVTSVSCLVLPLIWLGLPKIIAMFQISSALFETAFFVFFGTVVISMVELSIGVFGHVLYSLQRIVTERAVSMVTSLFEIVLIVFFLYLGFGIYGLLFAFVIKSLLSTLTYAILCFRSLPSLSIHIKHFNPQMLKLFYHYGGIVQLTGILSTIHDSIEKVIAGVVVGIKATGLFEIGRKFPVMANDLSASVNVVLFPATTYLHAKEMEAKIVKLYLKGSRYLNLISGVMFGFMAPFASPLIISWLGPEEKYHMAAVILAFFSLPYQMNVITGPPSAIYRSIGKPVRELMYTTSRLFLVLMAVWIGFTVFGYGIMVIIVGAASMIVLSCFLYLFYSNRFLQVSQKTYLRHILLPGIIPYGFGYALFWAMKPWFAAPFHSRWETLGFLTIAFVTYLLIVPFFLYRCVLDRGEREYLKGQVMHTLGEMFQKKTSSS